MRLHKTCLPYMVIVAVVMTIYSIFLVHLTQSFGPGSSAEYSGGQDPWNYHPRPAEPPPCQCTQESLAGLGAGQEVVVGLSFPYKYFNSNHWFHISEYYVSRHTHVAGHLPKNATVYIVAPHELFVANLIPMTFFLLLLAFTDGTTRTAEVLPRRALAQLAVTGNVLALDNVGVESYVYNRSLPAFHRTRKYEPGQRQVGQQHPRGLAAVLEGGGAGAKEGARIPTIHEKVGTAAAAAAARTEGGPPSARAAARQAAAVSKQSTTGDGGADARAGAAADAGASGASARRRGGDGGRDDDRGSSSGSGVERHRRRSLQGKAVAPVGHEAGETSGAASSASRLRASEESDEEAWRASLSASGNREQGRGVRAGAGGAGGSRGEERGGETERRGREDAGEALLAFDFDWVGDGQGDGGAGGGSWSAGGERGSILPSETLEPFAADARALSAAVAAATRQQLDGGNIDGEDLEHLRHREEPNAVASASAVAASAAGKSAASALDSARALTAQEHGTDHAVESVPAPSSPPPLPRPPPPQHQQQQQRGGEDVGDRAEGDETAGARPSHRGGDDDHHAGEYRAAPAEFFPLATLAGQREQQLQPATRPCACAKYIGEFGSAPVERGYWFKEEKVENTRARIDALCGDIYRRRREAEATGAGDGEDGQTGRKRLVIYQRNHDRRLLALDENVKVFQGLLGPEWDVVPIVHDNEHEPCWLYSQLMDADMLLTPHGFQSMLLLFLPPGATILEVFPYKYWKEGYAPLAEEWEVTHEHIMSRPVSWEKRLALFFVPLERCMKSIHCRKWSRGADVRLEEHHLRQIAKAAEQASKEKKDFLPPPAPVARKRARRS